MCTKTERIEPRTEADALSMMDAALDLLTSADMRGLGTGVQREALAALGRITARTSAVRAATLAAFEAAGGPEEDGYRNGAAWLRFSDGESKGAARAESKQARTLAAHPVVAGALAAGRIRGSIAALITGWTGKLPSGHRDEADGILVTAAEAGCDDHDLNVLGAKLLEEYKKTRPDEDGPVPADPSGDRALWLEETLDGAGKLRGDLTPEAAAALRAVLDSLGKKRGPEDERTVPQRHHDALAEALSRLLAAGGLPQRHGSATRGEVLLSFAELRGMDGASALEEAWLGAHTAGSPVFLTGSAAQGVACDASLFPVVTGSPDWARIETIIEIVRDAHSRDRSRALTAEEWQALRQAIAEQAIGFVSGPGGLAAALRTGLTGYGSPSLPLDIGRAETIPGWLRTAVIARDRHCAWAGGCDQPPAACEVHHLIPKSQGGTTSLGNCGLFCTYHHLIVIHAWGWTARLLPGGTWEAVSPGGETVYRSHAPPATRAA